MKIAVLIACLSLAGCNAALNKQFQNHVFGKCSQYSAPGSCVR